MTQVAAQSASQKAMTLLSQMLLPLRNDAKANSPARIDLKRELLKLSRAEFDELLELADSNHVIVRGLEVFLNLMREEGDSVRAEWAESALAVERTRIHTALIFLHEICSAFEEHDHSVTVIKSLDHWPDLGSDLDLYTDAKPEVVFKLMSRRFCAQVAPQSWGDRLAHKWNFHVPGLPEAVEVHIGRLGQTGEQVSLASSLLERKCKVFSKWFYISCSVEF